MGAHDRVSSSDTDLQILIGLSHYGTNEGHTTPDGGALLVTVTVGASDERGPYSFANVLLFLLTSGTKIFPATGPPTAAHPLDF